MPSGECLSSEAWCPYLIELFLVVTSIIIRLLLLTVESGTVASGVSIASLAYYIKNPASSNLLVLVSSQIVE